jgi:hypothetical protein
MGQTKWLIIFVTVVIVAIIVGGGVYLWQNKEAQPAQTVNQEQKALSLADCSKIGSSWALFSNNGTSLSFCYKTSWGSTELKETGISPAARKGTVYYVSFSKSINNYPLISYSTLDFQKTGDNDVPAIIDWKALDFNKSETELARLFSENATAQKITVNDKQVLKAHSNFIEPLSQERVKSVDYFVPNIVINGTTYNLHILGSSEQEADLDKLLESMVF